MLNAYLYNGLRTPFGRNAGALATVRPDDMLGKVIHSVIDASSFQKPLEMM
jgi:acetyl-CoA C-acetyltransferase